MDVLLREEETQRRKDKFLAAGVKLDGHNEAECDEACLARGAVGGVTEAGGEEGSGDEEGIGKDRFEVVLQCFERVLDLRRKKLFPRRGNWVRRCGAQVLQTRYDREAVKMCEELGLPALEIIEREPCRRELIPCGAGDEDVKAAVDTDAEGEAREVNALRKHGGGAGVVVHF